MPRLFSQIISSIVSLTLLLTGVAWAESARSLIDAGNKAFEQSNYELSLEKYDKAAEAVPDSAIVLFNRGDVLYKQEKFTEALNAFEQAAAKALADDDRVLAARSRYNMGNSLFRRAQELRREKPEMALEEFKRSSGYYQSALELDPEFTDAAYNLETSRIATKQVEELIRQQKREAQQQERQKQDIARELENLQQEQQAAAEDSSELDKARQQQGVENKGTGQTGQLAENQQSITDRTTASGEKLEQLTQDADADPADEMAREHVKRAIEKQEEAEKNLQQDDLTAAHANQQAASRELQKALQQLEQNSDREKGEDSSAPQGEETEKKQGAEQQKLMADQSPVEETEQQGGQNPPISGSYGDMSPEDIINEEIENQKYRSMGGTSGYKPVERDW